MKQNMLSNWNMILWQGMVFSPNPPKSAHLFICSDSHTTSNSLVFLLTFANPFTQKQSAISRPFGYYSISFPSVLNCIPFIPFFIVKELFRFFCWSRAEGKKKDRNFTFKVTPKLSELKIKISALPCLAD